MIITDLNGTPIEVTDLDKALAQADSLEGISILTTPTRR